MSRASKAVESAWGGWRGSEWIYLASKKKRDHVIKSELVAKEKILPALGFDYVIRFAEVNIRHGYQQRFFSFDFYCERKDEKWLIDVTMVRAKRIDKAFVQIFKRINPNLKIGIIHIKRDFTQYIFREITDDKLFSDIKEITSRITKDDFVFGRVKNV